MVFLFRSKKLPVKGPRRVPSSRKLRFDILEDRALLSFAIAPTAATQDITYQLISYPADQNGHSLSGTIVTDGTLGSIDNSHIKSISQIAIDGVVFSPHPVIASMGDLYATESQLSLAEGYYFNIYSEYSEIDSWGVVWSRLSTPNQESVYYAVDNTVDPERLYWLTKNPSMGGTDPWVIAGAPDIVATGLKWNASRGGVDLSYRVTGARLPRDTTAQLYWATGPTEADIILPRTSALNAPVTIRKTSPLNQTVTFHLVPSRFAGNPPSEATHLVLVVDPDNTIAESDEANNVKAIAASYLNVVGLTWRKQDGGVDIEVKVLGKELQEDTTVALYWAGGKNFADVQGKPFFSTVVKAKTTKTKLIHVRPDEFMSYPEYSVTPPRINATYMIAKVDPDTDDDNVKARALGAVTIGKDFKTEEDSQTLSAGLIENFMRLSTKLIAHNLIMIKSTKLIQGNITLNEALRSRAKAHQWSTAYTILNVAKHNSTLLKNLQALPAGKDLDENVWYQRSWEDGLPRNKKGKLTPEGLTKLWDKIKVQARRNVPDRTAPEKPAAEGYETNDARILPNTYPKVSRHVFGNALDASVPWRNGAKLGNLTLKDGKAGDQLAEQLVSDAGLVRPLLAIFPVKKREWWHFELPTPASNAATAENQPVVEEQSSLFVDFAIRLREPRVGASVSLGAPGAPLANAIEEVDGKELSAARLGAMSLVYPESSFVKRRKNSKPIDSLVDSADGPAWSEAAARTVDVALAEFPAGIL